MPGLGWRWLLVLSSLPSFAAVAFYGFTVESPRYLCTIGRIKDAHNILQRIAEVNQTKLPIGTLYCEQMTVVNQEALLPKEDNSYARYKAGFSALFSVFSPNLIGPTLLIWVLYFGNAFLYYGVILMTSELTQTNCSSITSNSNDSSTLYRDVFITSLAGKLKKLILLVSVLIPHAICCFSFQLIAKQSWSLPLLFFQRFLVLF